MLDEVTSALDPELKDKVVDYFLQNKDLTLFVVSHDDVWERDETSSIVFILTVVVRVSDDITLLFGFCHI